MWTTVRIFTKMFIPIRSMILPSNKLTSMMTSSALPSTSSKLTCSKSATACTTTSPSSSPSFSKTKRPRSQPRIQYRLISGPEGRLTLPDNHGEIYYIPDFLSNEKAWQFYHDTLNSTAWKRSPITFFGRTLTEPRDTALFGTMKYSYSGDSTRIPIEWNENPPASTAVKEIGLQIEELLGLQKHYFNVVLANKYFHGADFMGWHSDDEQSLGPEPIIASVSIGAERRFLVKKKKKVIKSNYVDNNHSIGNDDDDDDEFVTEDKIEYILKHGSLLVMSGKMQQFYQHSLPKVTRNKCDDVRLNFTYRRVLDEHNLRKGW